MHAVLDQSLLGLLLEANGLQLFPVSTLRTVPAVDTSVRRLCAQILDRPKFLLFPGGRINTNEVLSILITLAVEAASGG
jgi:hypothetical protein